MIIEIEIHLATKLPSRGQKFRWYFGGKNARSELISIYFYFGLSNWFSVFFSFFEWNVVQQGCRICLKRRFQSIRSIKKHIYNHDDYDCVCHRHHNRHICPVLLLVFSFVCVSLCTILFKMHCIRMSFGRMEWMDKRTKRRR